ncbi:PREDICTED: uncharacterized protein LOC108365614 isoform X2 [Rhagoletis zephyria]|uniref:uncharacterized protein LOC108365614 isoform X2 n=1 Tax=Rhagoletis zephyria TaxID=28612 RepID=UPI0008115EB3|nr:PREDICTED: uncharacterized protein LOC108365614 isoform X2 [Rhagoletis zephyria]
MDGTPRLKKRVSLTLARHHRRDASPHILHEKVRSKIISNVNNIDENDEYNTPKSPSETSLSTDVGIECTPPHKKINLDESVDYSPKCFDTSYSPTCLLSQTLSSNSPEVGWKWGKRSVDEQLETAVTPDSAYAADSSLTSAGSSSTEVINSVGRIRSESHVQPFAYEMRREEQRRRLEIQMRRAEKLRADELLKQRCARLEEQLHEAEKRRREGMEKKIDSEIQSQSQNVEILESFPKLLQTEEAVVEDIFTNKNDTLDDFLNDSNDDGIMLIASQQVESNIVDITQKSSIEVLKSAENSYNSTKKENSSESETSRLSKETIAPERQDKRSSQYMKFLEDDDLFLSIDEVILQDTQQAKKPRNNFQRHNSMPINTSAIGSAKAAEIKPTVSTSKSNEIMSTASTTNTVYSLKMKRHASSHALSLSSDRDRHGYNRK